MTKISSQYAKFLPAVYRQSGLDSNDPAFLERFLLIFETILGRASIPPTDNPDGDDKPQRKGMADLIDVLPDFFYPQYAMLFPDDDSFLPPFSDPDANANETQTTEYTNEILGRLNSYIGAANPDTDPNWAEATTEWLNEFLNWQFSWIALQADEEWSVDDKRRVLSSSLNNFRNRGTVSGLTAVISDFSKADFNVQNISDTTPMIVGVNTALENSFTLGDPVVGGVRPFSFLVEVFVSTHDLSSPSVDAELAPVKQIIDREKPAHSNCLLRASPYVFKLGVCSTLGLSTLLPATDSSREPSS